MKIFVTKLGYNTNDDSLKEAFETYGSVESAKVVMDHFTGKSRGFGFVEMLNKKEATEAINKLDESELDGRYIIVKKAEERSNRVGFSNEKY